MVITPVVNFFLTLPDCIVLVFLTIRLASWFFNLPFISFFIELWTQRLDKEVMTEFLVTEIVSPYLQVPAYTPEDCISPVSQSSSSVDQDSQNFFSRSCSSLQQGLPSTQALMVTLSSDRVHDCLLLQATASKDCTHTSDVYTTCQDQDALVCWPSSRWWIYMPWDLT